MSERSRKYIDTYLATHKGISRGSTRFLIAFIWLSTALQMHGSYPWLTQLAMET